MTKRGPIAFPGRVCKECKRDDKKYYTRTEDKTPFRTCSDCMSKKQLAYKRSKLGQVRSSDRAYQRNKRRHEVLGKRLEKRKELEYDDNHRQEWLFDD